ncbi:UDP-2,3-diacylglucosamine diphosphatase [Sulfurovum sp. ST-21]|uniref:UDP-2,3-diacylglucosamine diphosphatase n=1 Tax=Sulfurovum indicum TaxID=2779528 RepID=A0A7M1S5L6_9BACT|nr:metallophosphoesterase [Sulfurovum indicum]QOR62725.1 UDP-2,3-diacylglucosamine diphosphatase [Sulfurovum indicum]
MRNKECRVVIKEGALFVADSHYPHHGDDFLTLIQKLDEGVLEVPQLFLMGDNFDLLFGYNDYIQTFSSEAIALLQKLSKKLEIHYFEGNHDFCLQALFPNMTVYSREEQPVRFTLDNKVAAISHGDKYVTGFGYDLYCKLLRSKTTLTLLKPWEKKIIDHRMGKLARKKICRTFHGFEKRVDAILEHYEDEDLVIEGHFHQAKIFGKYVSLPSLACQKEVAMAENGNIVFKKADTLSA